MHRVVASRRSWPCSRAQPTASADRGVALDLGKVEIEQALTPGGGYQLPPVGVRNPGDELTTYRMVVSSVAGQSRTPVPASWLHFSPREVTLRPGKTTKVQPRLSLPTGADPGDYEGLLAAQIVTEGGGAQVGAAAAAKVSFEVESTTLLGAWWHKLSTVVHRARAVDVARPGRARFGTRRLAAQAAVLLPGGEANMRRLALVFAALAVAGASSAQAGDSGSITGRVLVNPLSVDVTFPGDPIKSGRWFQHHGASGQRGPDALDKVQVTLVRPAQLNLDRAATQAIPHVPARGSKPAKWQACSNTPGNYVVLARAVVGAYVSESPAKVVQIAAASKNTC